MTRRRIDRAMVELAIAEIEATGKPVTVKELAAITGYSSGGLQNQGYLKKYIKAYKPKAPAPSPIKQIAIDHSVESYCQHILCQYFASDEHRDEVKLEMLAEVEGFKPSIYEKAINRLMIDRCLLLNRLNGKLSINPAMVCEDEFEAEQMEMWEKMTVDKEMAAIFKTTTPAINALYDEGNIRIEPAMPVKPAIRELHLKLDDGAEFHITSGEVTQELVQEILKTIFNRVC